MLLGGKRRETVHFRWPKLRIQEVFQEINGKISITSNEERKEISANDFSNCRIEFESDNFNRIHFAMNGNAWETLYGNNKEILKKVIP